LVLSGCYSQKISEAYDRDNDGFPSDQLGGPDCDDENAAVFPGAVEICGNNLDDDCSGIVDDAGTGDVTYYTDKDGDGFPGTTPSSSCTAPPGSFTSLAAGADCDDSDAAVSPGVAEVWYDGVDQNCDGNDTDQDGDGFDAVSAGGGDCEDTLENVNPGVVEICNNGVDDDCDGGAGPCALVGDVDAGELVHAVTGAVGRLDIGDYTGDNLSDMMIHGAGRSDWMAGPVSGILGTLTWDSGLFHFAGGSASVASGNVDDDGLIDVLWAQSPGLKLQPGPLGRAADTPDSTAWLAAPSGESWYGNRISISEMGRGVLRRTTGPGTLRASWSEHGPAEVGMVSATVLVSDSALSDVHDGLSSSGFYSWSGSSVTWWEAPDLSEQVVVLPTGIGSISGVTLLGDDWAGWVLVAHGNSQPRMTVVDASVDPSLWTSELATVEFSVGVKMVSGALCDINADGVEDLVVGFFEGQMDTPTRYGLAIFAGPIDTLTSESQPAATILEAGIETLACADMTNDAVEDIIASDSLNGFTEVLAGRGL
jgi:hypothetical protein